MLLIGLFTKYFLLLMIIQGILVGIIDAARFKKSNMPDTAKKARILGIGSIALGLLLYTIRALS